MKRYKITLELKNAIRNSNYSLDKLNKMLCFQIRNIHYKNQSIRADHLQKLKDLLDINLNLEEINLNYGKNLGEQAITKPIKPLQEEDDLAELLGIMLGDGNIYKNQINIFFDKRDNTYIGYVKSLVKKLTGINLKENAEEGGNQFRLRCCNKYLIEKLLEFGLERGDKIKNQ